MNNWQGININLTKLLCSIFTYNVGNQHPVLEPKNEINVFVVYLITLLVAEAIWH